MKVRLKRPVGVCPVGTIGEVIKFYQMDYVVFIVAFYGYTGLYDVPSNFVESI